ncbi:hypothetical protein [Pontimicrobium sp. MEBiC01747]|jgi:xanthine/uracil permease
MNKKAIITGFITGLAVTFIGITIYVLYLNASLGLESKEIIQKIVSFSTIKNYAGIGILLNLPVFYYFLSRKKEDYAKGLILAIIIVAIIFLVNKF